MKAAKWTLLLGLALVWGFAGCSKKGGEPAPVDSAPKTGAAPASGSTAGPAEEDGFKPVQVQEMKSMSVDCGNGVSMKLVLIPKGKFMMGSTSTEPGRMDKEGPRRQVTLTRPFWLGVTEVTQQQFEAVLGVNPSHTKGDKNPMEWVSWQDAVKFCNRLSEKTGKKFRLPTEAEWEYACRAGTQTAWYWGDNSRDLGYYAVCKSNAKGNNISEPVGTKHPNQWGLYDMIGNVWELVHDCDSANYDMNDVIDPTGNKADVGIKVARGGSMCYGPDQCRASYRLAQGLTITLFDSGFRVACEKE